MNDELLDRDTPEARDRLEETARRWFELVRKSDPTYTLDDARRRVAGARARGDRIRANGNR